MGQQSSILANRFREVMLNGTWIARTNFKDQLGQVNWEQAQQRMGSLNSIAALTFHIHYYVAGVLQVLEGGELDIRDQYSFDLPPLDEAGWERLKQQFFRDAERFAQRVERMSDRELEATFVKEAYGTYQRNIDGLIEHAYYHLGQVRLIRKLTEKDYLF